MKTIILHGFLISLILLISCGGGTGELIGKRVPVVISNVKTATELTRKASVNVLVDQFNNPTNSLVDFDLVSLTDSFTDLRDINPGYWNISIPIVPESSASTVSVSTQQYFSDYQFNDSEDLYKTYPKNKFLVASMDRMITFLCAITQIHASADFPFFNGYPRDGSYNTYINSDVENKVYKECGYSNSFSTGPFNYDVESVDGTSFVKKITITTPAPGATWYFGIDRERFNVGVQGENTRGLYFENKINKQVSFEFVSLEDTGNRYLQRVFLDNELNFTQVTLNDNLSNLGFTLSGPTKEGYFGGGKYSQIALANMTSAGPTTTVMQACINSNINPPALSGLDYNFCNLTPPNYNSYPISWLGGTYTSLRDITLNSNWNCINGNSIRNFAEWNNYKAFFATVNTNLCN